MLDPDQEPVPAADANSENVSAFRVSPAHDRRDIFFEFMVPANKIPREQLDLRDRVGSALVVLRMILPPGDRFEEYYTAILSLAQLGLVGSTANPDAAERALDELKRDVVAREAGRIKNGYMRSLGLAAAGTTSVLLVIFLLLYFINPVAKAARHISLFEAATMIGVWLSFGTRNPVLKFEDLNVLEDDRLEPFIRLVFSGLLALVLALAFHLQVVVVSFGTLTTKAIDADAYAAWFVGLLAGVSEKALSTQVSRQAAALLK